MLTPLTLSRLPTPLQPLHRISAQIGVEVWIKRDDLTGLGLSGNKVRKLDVLLAEARAAGATAVITCGGIQSNHCRATAVACRQLGLRPVLLLRGAPPADDRDWDSNLLLDVMLGAELRWTDAEGYRTRRNEQMAEIAEEMRAAGEVPFVIPEGGSNAAGAMGFVRAGQELAAQLTATGLRFDAVISATGSGGTLAGLAMSGLRPQVLGVAVCDDRSYFRDRVEAIGEEAAARFGLTLPREGWDVVEGFQGTGYAQTQPAELADQMRMARAEGILLDPVYTGKAWHALASLGRELGERVVLWHTGGLFGAFGRGAAYREAARSMGGR